MPKNIIILSDGTGQAGGMAVDENRSNVYKLYRATRVGPDTSIEPTEQVAFYDAGLGSAPINGGFFTTIGRYIHNFVSQATGYGLTANIVDCYDMIIRLWSPDDRIFLIGFSRGAYTVRGLAGVLRLCGVPTKIGDGALTYDPATTRAIAKEAVKCVYQHTASWERAEATPRQNQLLDQRDELARQFRKHYSSSNEQGESNGYPYFVGVFDTVAALASKGSLLILTGASFLTAALIAGVLRHFYPLYREWFWGFPSWFLSAALSWSEFDPSSLFSWLIFVVVISVVGILIGAAIDSFRSAPTVHNLGPTAHFEWGPLRFYDRALSDNVKYGKHALSIDENRQDFPRVPWGDPRSTRPEFDEKGNKTFEQVWFAGNHSDIGGSYPENESRLSDTALGWMVEVATAVPHPMKLDRSVLHLHPDPAGMQHDAVKEGIAFVTKWTGKSWSLLHRPTSGHVATIHESVRLRFDAGPVLHYDEVKLYRPETLRVVDAYKHFFEGMPYSICPCATCRKIREIPINAPTIIAKSP
jgi:uncharacterized protein (DUF2235 family)